MEKFIALDDDVTNPELQEELEALANIKNELVNLKIWVNGSFWCLF